MHGIHERYKAVSQASHIRHNAAAKDGKTQCTPVPGMTAKLHVFTSMHLLQLLSNVAADIKHIYV